MSIKGSGEHFVASSIANSSDDLRVPPRENGVTTIHYEEGRFPEYTIHIEAWESFVNQPYAENYVENLDLEDPEYVVRAVDHELEENSIEVYENINAEKLEKEVREIMEEGTGLNFSHR